MAFGKERTWTVRNLAMCFVVSLAQVAFGYPSGVIAVTLAQPSFLIYMGLLDLKADPPRLTDEAQGLIGAMSGVFQAGAFFNVFISCYIADKWGRKAAFHYCCLLSLFGGALLCGSQSVAMFIVARFFAGAGSWGYLVVTPFYTAELAPPALRGFMVGLNGVNLTFGYALSSLMGLAFYHVKDPSAQWRAPLGLALIWPILVSISCFFIPESPRYLLMHGRIDEAREVIYMIHASKDDPDQEFVRGEFYQMTKQAELDRENTPGYIEMFRRPSYRRRALVTMGFAFFAQSTGILVLANYGPTIYKELGYDTEKQMVYQCGWSLVGTAGSAISALAVDRVGRKPLLMIGLAGCAVFMSIEAAMVALYTKEGTNKAGLTMGVAATYIFLLFETIAYDGAGIVLFSEIYPSHLRARGLALSIATVALVDLVYLEVAETAFTHIGWRFYLIFVILAAIGVVFTYFVIPETKGIPLEEIGAIFGDEVAVYSEDIHIDHHTHELIVDEHNAKSDNRLGRVASETDVEKRPSTGASKLEANHPSVQHVSVADTVKD